MASLGRLERAVMDALWKMAADAPEDAFTARDVAATLPNHAYTTVLTVMDRLRKKGLLERIRDGKSHHYRPTGTPASHIAELMHDALASTSDREAALVHFVETVPPAETNALRQALDRLPETRRPPRAR